MNDDIQTIGMNGLEELQEQMLIALVKKQVVQ